NMLIDETGDLRPVSRYAQQKVAIEREVIAHPTLITATCLRFATLYGSSRRMRFDLTVNEFTRDVWLNRPLQVFGESFWRPYVHVKDAARAITLVLGRSEELVNREVFNVGDSSENYRKIDVVETITGVLGRGHVSYIHRDEDPRDYKVSFAKVAAMLAYSTTKTVRDGVSELVAAF